MKWVSLRLLALVLSLSICDRAVSQTSHQQNKQRANDNVLFLMGGQPGATFNQIANDISVVLGDGNNLRVLSVPKLFKTLGIDVQEFYMPQGDALEKLRHGEIDATICSCPTPVPAFANVRPDWGLRFVSVPYEKSIQESYLPASIGNGDYPTLIGKEESVDTIAASTILISYNWQKGTVRYERTAKFVDAFFSKISEFYKPPRNPLWKSVNLAATIPGWTRFPEIGRASCR